VGSGLTAAVGAGASEGMRESVPDGATGTSAGLAVVGCVVGPPVRPVAGADVFSESEWSLPPNASTSPVMAPIKPTGSPISASRTSAFLSPRPPKTRRHKVLRSLLPEGGGLVGGYCVAQPATAAARSRVRTSSSVCGVDVMSDLLHRARARNAVVRQLVQRPPWSLGFAEAPPLTVVAALGGRAAIRLHDGDAATGRLAPGDIALISRTGGYTIADDPATPPQLVIRGGRKHPAGGGAEAPTARRNLAPRTYGDGLPGATTMLRGAYELRGDVSERLLDLLPRLAIVPAGPTTQGALGLLAAEVGRQEPGQDAVLDRLLDLVLVLALRAWCAAPDAAPPAWYRALDDPAVGDALRLMHEEPSRRWTVAGLAAEVGRSRAAFAARFTRLVGEPPLAYLTGWRMALGADLLRDSEATVATVARQVGYEDAFAFSVAFKRARGVSPSAWRRQAG